MEITPNHRDTEQDAIAYLLQEKWQRRGAKLVTADPLLPEAVDLHFAELSSQVREKIGFATVGDPSGGKRLMLDAANAQSFFEERGTPLSVEAGPRQAR